MKVILGSQQDFNEYLTRIKNHDQRTLKIYWSRAINLNKKSSNQWFLVLNRQTPHSSIVSILPVTVLPLLEKMIAPHRWRVGTVFTPTPTGECLAFGERVGDGAEKLEEKLEIKEIKKRGRPKKVNHEFESTISQAL